jgi:hypothetical protein
MNKILENDVDGELWLRTPSGKILPSTDALSALNLKYSTVNTDFYSELINNQIKRFDFFYDVIFLETETGYIFDKLTKNNNILIPSNNDDRLIITANGNKFPDYWLDEVNKKIYVVDNQIKYWTSTNVKINVTIKQFDILKNTYSSKFSYDINLTYCNFSNLTKKPILEPCKISYNNDTRCFNVSFILRGNKDEFGIISTILKKDQNLVIDNINCLLPYATLQSITTDVIVDKLLETDFYS